MPVLLCIGLGYSAEHFVAAFGHKFVRLIGTMRSKERAAILNAYDGAKLRALVFNGRSATPELEDAIAAADAVLISIPQDDSGDPLLRVCGDAFRHAHRLRSIVYLSTVGVYGPGRNALMQVARGNARCIVKPGQVFNRVHVADIGQAIDAAFTFRASGIFNVADDEPSPPGDPLMFAAELLGVATPPKVSYQEAAPAMSPLAMSFWQECRRVRNDKLKRELGVTLRYPTYREGLRALFEEHRAVNAGSAL